MEHAFPQLMHGLGRTVEFSLIAIIFASIIGLIAALCKLSRFKVLRGISWLYVEIFRNPATSTTTFYRIRIANNYSIK
jgi:His/Glu/Gln/Arg/opine family amino acid ABC transporter permease subunit